MGLAGSFAYLVISTVTGLATLCVLAAAASRLYQAFASRLRHDGGLLVLAPGADGGLVVVAKEGVEHGELPGQRVSRRSGYRFADKDTRQG